MKRLVYFLLFALSGATPVLGSVKYEIETSPKIAIKAFSPEEADLFVKPMGLEKDGNFSIETFNRWFSQSFIGFNENNLGYDLETQRPIIPNSYFREWTWYLNIAKGSITQLPNFSIMSMPNEHSKYYKEYVLQLRNALETEKTFEASFIDNNFLIQFNNGELIVNNNTFKYNQSNIYAISASGMFYIGSDSNIGHPSLLRGKPVWCAGHVTIDDNKRISFLSNASGHYWPHIYQLYTFIKYLSKKNCFSAETRIEVTSITDETPPQIKFEKFDSASSFLQNYNKETLKEDWEKHIRSKIETNLSSYKRFIFS